MGLVLLKVGMVEQNFFFALRAPNNTNPLFKILDLPLLLPMIAQMRLEINIHEVSMQCL